jgi:hypothetical protein
MSGWHVVGWKLDRAQRGELLGRFAPKYANAVADHVTLKAGVDANTPRPKTTEGRIVGRADDGRGVEAMVVQIDGTTDRPGGGTYHITWSLAEGRKAKESNDVIAARGWDTLAEPVPVALEGAMF